MQAGQHNCPTASTIRAAQVKANSLNKLEVNSLKMDKIKEEVDSKKLL